MEVWIERNVINKDYEVKMQVLIPDKEYDYNKLSFIWQDNLTRASIYLGSMYLYFKNEEKFRDYWIPDTASWKANPDYLVQNEIGAVIAILWKNNWDSYGLEKQNIKVLKLEQLDKQGKEQMWNNIKLANDFIAQQLSLGKNILVHCEQGVSRSVTLVLAYLVFVKHCELRDCLQMIQSNRPVANPWSGYLQLIIEKFQQLTGKEKAKFHKCLGWVIKPQLQQVLFEQKPIQSLQSPEEEGIEYAKTFTNDWNQYEYSKNYL